MEIAPSAMAGPTGPVVSMKELAAAIPDQLMSQSVQAIICANFSVQARYARKQLVHAPIERLRKPSLTVYAPYAMHSKHISRGRKAE